MWIALKKRLNFVLHIFYHHYCAVHLFVPLYSCITKVLRIYQDLCNGRYNIRRTSAGTYGWSYIWQNFDHLLAGKLFLMPKLWILKPQNQHQQSENVFIFAYTKLSVYISVQFSKGSWFSHSKNRHIAFWISKPNLLYELFYILSSFFRIFVFRSQMYTPL